MPLRREDLVLESRALYAAKALYTHAGSVWWQVRTGARRYGAGLRILAYHRVSPERDELAVAPQRFRQQMEHLAASGYRVVGVAEAGTALDDSEPSRIVGLTFDDGYRDVLDNAVPVLAELGFRATVFVPTGAIDGTHPFTWYNRPVSVLDWSTIVELDRGPTLDFGAHTISHTNLLELGEAAAEREIAGSKEALEAKLGHPVDAFCYPAGLFGDRERRLVRASGFRFAVCGEPGANGPNTDRMALRRVGIGPRDRLFDFRAKLGGAHDRPPPLRGLYRSIRFGSPRSPSEHD